MATLDWHQTRTDGVTLVELLVTAETETEVKIESNLSPVWPPRRQGQPVAGWDGSTFTAAVDASERLVVGYASPAAPDGKPAELQTAPPEASTEETNADPRAVVRALGEARPPRDLLAEPPQSSEPNPKPSSATDPTTEPSPSADPEKWQRQSESATPSRRPDDRHRVSKPARGSVGVAEPDGTAAELEGYFDTVEKRLRDATRLASVESSEEARTAVTETGGIEAVRQLQAGLAADRERIAEIEQRCQQLSGQLQATEIPVETLERLA